MRLAVWSPLPPSPSGIADFVAEALPVLHQATDLVCVVPDPNEVDPVLRSAYEVCRPDAAEADLHLYHVGNSPPHGYVLSAALTRPGVVVLHEQNLHHLVLSLTVEQGDSATYRRMMRREHGERGSLLAGQIARGLGGTMLPAVFPLCEDVLRASLAVVGLSRRLCSAAGRVIAPRPARHVPHHLALPGDPPDRNAARRILKLPSEALVVTIPGLATRHKGIEVAIRAVARLRARHPNVLLVVAGAEEPGLPVDKWLAEHGLGRTCLRTGRLPMDRFVAHLAASDVVLGLRFPSFGEVSGAMVRALGLGCAALVSEGTASAEELPRGSFVPIPPGPHEEIALCSARDALCSDVRLREAIGAAGAAWVRNRHDLNTVTRDLVSFLVEVAQRRSELETHIERPAEVRSVLDDLIEEARWHARDLGLGALPLRAWFADLAGDQL